MNVILQHPASGKKVKVKKGFSVRFLIFGSLNYLFSGRFIKTLFSWIWLCLTLVWLYSAKGTVTDFVCDRFDNLTNFFGNTLKVKELESFFAEATVKFASEINCRLFDIKGYEITRLAVLGFALFLIVRIWVASRYNKRRIKRLKKQGFVIIDSPTDSAPIVAPVPVPVPYTTGTHRVPPPVAATTGKNPVTPTPAPFSYETHNTRAQVRAGQSKRAVELHLLNEAYAAGLITYEVYQAKRALLDD